MTRLITIFIMLSGVVLGQTYNVAITNEVIVGAVTVTASVEIAEGAVTVNSTSTVDASISSGAFSGATFEVNSYTTITGVAGVVTVPTNAYAPPTTNSGVVTVFIPTNSGGGSSFSVYDSTNGLLSAAVTSILFNSQFTLTGSNAVSVSLVAIPDGYIGTNRATYNYTGGEQIFTVPAGISNVTFWLWGGGAPYLSGAGGGAGGHSVALIATYPGEQFRLRVGQGGVYALPTSTYTLGVAAYPNGGRGFSATNLTLNVAGGGGRSDVFRLTDTQVVAVAGGGGGAVAGSTAALSGSGGGLSGGDAGSPDSTPSSYGGYGGTQSAGGSGAWSLAAYTNTIATNAYRLATAGSGYSGGDGGVATNANAAGAGGGDGYYGGGGSYVKAVGGASNAGRAGGAGSGYVNSAILIFGETYRQSSASATTPPATEYGFYGAGIGVGNVGASGGNGQITVGY